MLFNSINHASHWAPGLCSPISVQWLFNILDYNCNLLCYDIIISYCAWTGGYLDFVLTFDGSAVCGLLCCCDKERCLLRLQCRLVCDWRFKGRNNLGDQSCAVPCVCVMHIHRLTWQCVIIFRLKIDVLLQNFTNLWDLNDGRRREKVFFLNIYL